MELQMTIIFLFILIVSSAAEEVKNQSGIKGGSITFPDPVEDGFLTLDGVIIAQVKDKKIYVWGESYKDRLLWNNTTGLFTISGLKRNDSGYYGIDSKKGNASFKKHKLTVYESVAAPSVKALNVSTNSCSLLCWVDKTEETTLLWYKDEDIINRSSSALLQPLTINRHDFRSSYRCVAENPAENKSLHVNATNICVEIDGTSSQSDSNSPRSYTIIIPVVFVGIVILIALFIRWRFFLKHKKSTTETQVNRDADVVYSDIHINEDRCSQGRNVPDSSSPDEHHSLRSVYYKLGQHRLSPLETDDHVYDQTNFPHA